MKIELTEDEQKLIAEFGFREGMRMVHEGWKIAEHCRRNNITSHSVDASGYCNMGCC